MNKKFVEFFWKLMWRGVDSKLFRFSGLCTQFLELKFKLKSVISCKFLRDLKRCKFYLIHF